MLEVVVFTAIQRKLLPLSWVHNRKRVEIIWASPPATPKENRPWALAALILEPFFGRRAPRPVDLGSAPVRST